MAAKAYLITINPALGPRTQSPFTSLALSEPVASARWRTPHARYLNSFLVTEQLEGAAVVLGEGGDLEVKGRRPPLSLLGKRFRLKTELNWIIYHLPFSHVISNNQHAPGGKGVTTQRTRRLRVLVQERDVFAFQGGRPSLHIGLPLTDSARKKWLAGSHESSGCKTETQEVTELQDLIKATAPHFNGQQKPPAVVCIILCQAPHCADGSPCNLKRQAPLFSFCRQRWRLGRPSPRSLASA